MTMCIYHCYNYITKHPLEDLTMLEVALKKKKKKKKCRLSILRKGRVAVSNFGVEGHYSVWTV